MSVIRAGYFAVPAGTGNLTVNLLDDFGGPSYMTPHTVIFFGSNQGTEDAVVNVSTSSIFMGMMTRKANGTWLSRVNSVIPVSVAAGTRGDCCINAITGTGFGIQYRASAVSSSTGSFTVNFSTVAASRIVHYLAIGDSDNYEAVFNDVFSGTGTTTTTLAWPVKAMFHIGAYAYDGGGFNYENGSLAFGFSGGAAYPDYPTLNRGDASSLSYSSGGSGQMKLKQYNRIAEAPPVVSVGATFSGPFLGEVDHSAYRSPSNTDFYADVSGFGDSALFGFWDGDADAGSGTPSGSVSGTATFAPQRGEVDAVLFFSANGLAEGPAINSSALAVGFGVWTPSYQGCCHLSGSGASYLYQSRTKSWCSTANASGAVAGTVVRSGSDFYTVTAVAGTTATPLIWWGGVSEAEPIHVSLDKVIFPQ